MGQRKSLESRRDESIHLRVTPSQKRAIERAAALSTLDPSTWVRMIALRETDWTPESEKKPQ